MSEAERVALGQTIAGKNQYKVLASVMSNFSHAADASATALESAGSAAQENARYMESWEAATNKLSAAWENLSTAVVGGGVNQIVSTLGDIVQALSESEVAVVAIQSILTSGVLWGGSQLLKAMQIIPAITGEFKNLGFIIQAVKGGAATLGEGLAAAFTSLSASLPIILAVVAGATALVAIIKGIKGAIEEAGYDNQLKILQDMTAEYDSMQAEIESLKAKGSNLTEYEKNRLAYLEAQTSEMEKQNTIANQQEKTWEAWDKGFKKNVTEKEHYVEINFEGEAILSSKKVVSYQKDFADLINMYDSGSVSVQEMTKSTTEYVNKYKDLVEQTRAYRDAGNELTPLQENLLYFYDVAVGQQAEFAKELGTTTEVLDEQYPAYETLAQKISDATAALEEFNTVSSIDYEAPLEGYTKAFAQFKADYEAGKVGAGSIRAAIDLFIPEEIQAQFKYDTEQLADFLANGITSRILTAEDPLREFYGYIQENAETLKGAIDLKDGGFVISSYAEAAERLGMTAPELEALVYALQEYNSQLILTTEETNNFLDGFRDIEGASSSIQNVVAAISEITGEADPSRIQQYAEILKQSGDINFTPTISQIQEAQTALEETAGETEDLSSTPVQVTFESLDDDIVATIQKITDFDGTSVNVAFKALWAGLGIKEHDAKGTKNSSGGLALVNDGNPVNGSAKELIVQDGQAFMMQGEPALVNLDKGATVYNASDTQKILGGIPAFGNGTLENSDEYDKLWEQEYLSNVVDYAKSHAKIRTGVGTVISAPTAVPGSSDKSSGGGTSSATTSQNAKEIFDAWLKEKKHALAMDEITEQEYYDALEEMNEKYFANNEEYQDEYWKYQEEIYKYRKSQLEDENDLLQKQLDLEEALNDMAKAQAGRKYIFSGGQFGYGQDYDAVASAQQRLRELGYNSSVAGLGVVSGGIGSANQSLPYSNSGIGSVSAGVGNNIFNIGEIKLDNVTDVDSFVSGLKNLALQYAGSRA